MKRPIKFRGMLRSGEWVYGGYVKIKDGANCILSGECNHYESDGKTINVLKFNAVKYKTVGQYTGLKDKNGVEIYEGDIVKHYQHTAYGWSNKPCYWLIGGFSRCGRINGTAVWGVDFSDTCGLDDAEAYKDLEVIGNIYENPELLGENSEDSNSK